MSFFNTCFFTFLRYYAIFHSPFTGDCKFQKHLRQTEYCKFCMVACKRTKKPDIITHQTSDISLI